MNLQDTIKKFQTLPPNIQQALSSDEAMAKMEALESKYNLKLASFVLRAAVREFSLEDLGIVIRKELNLKPEQAGLLKDEILDQIFAPVVNYYAESAEKKDETSSKHEVSNIKNPAFAGAAAEAESAGKQESRMAPPRPPVMPPRLQVAPPRVQPISSPVVLGELKQSEESQTAENTSFASIQDDKREKKDDNGEKRDDHEEKLMINSQKSSPKADSPRAESVISRPVVPPPQPPKSRSYFYFDAEDEKDVEKFKKHEAVIAGGTKDFLAQIDKAADETIDRSMIAISDENAKNRLKSYLTAYFRGIRDILQTKESLAKPAATGGIEFDAVSIEKIMALAKEEFRKIHSVGAEKKNESGKMNQESIGVDEKKAENTEKRDEVVAEKQELSNQVKSNSQDPGSKIHDSGQMNVRRERPQVIDTDKPKIAEVRLPSKLTGPLEEVEQLSLKDLRRFAQNHQGFADRTMERIKIMENESFEKRMAGIAAWRKSALYQQYLNVIQNSLERNISIPEMIGGVSEAESQNMSLREWQTINRLNHELKS